nr:VanZ family protein [Halobacterium salinarum]
MLSPPPVAPPRPDPLWDKKLHLLGYLCLGLALAYATAHRRDTILTRIAVVLVLAVGYGLLIEGLQATQPGRHPSLNDALANTIGALLASAWFVVERGGALRAPARVDGSNRCRPVGPGSRSPHVRGRERRLRSAVPVRPGRGALLVPCRRPRGPYGPTGDPYHARPPTHAHEGSLGRRPRCRHGRGRRRSR